MRATGIKESSKLLDNEDIMPTYKALKLPFNEWVLGGRGKPLKATVLMSLGEWSPASAMALCLCACLTNPVVPMVLALL